MSDDEIFITQKEITMTTQVDWLFIAQKEIMTDGIFIAQKEITKKEITMTNPILITRKEITMTIGILIAY